MGSILVLGAGELGIQILLSLARIAPQDTSLTVLLRSTTIDSPTSPQKQAELDMLRALGITFLRGDVVSCSDAELSALFKPYDTVLSCLGFAAGGDVQIKIARAVLEAGVERFFPWQFGVDYDVVGRGSAQDLDRRQLLFLADDNYFSLSTTLTVLSSQRHLLACPVNQPPAPGFALRLQPVHRGRVRRQALCRELVRYCVPARAGSWVY
jgi:hypothetical protein